MQTVQDLEKAKENGDAQLSEYLLGAIDSHKLSRQYAIAKIAKQYDERENVTICTYQKFLYTVSGKKIPDNFSANYKLRCGIFPRLVIQQVSHLLGNGVNWGKDDTEDRLGTKRFPFDAQLKDLAHKAIVMGVSFGFFNFDHIDVFDLLEFVPLFDEETGAIRAGIRFWQMDCNRPLRVTLYELDGYTEFIRRKGRTLETLKKKAAYIRTKRVMDNGDVEISDEQNYPGFPIVPLYGNRNHKSSFIGLRENIDCIDLIMSGYANTIDEASLLYWTIVGAGGMDDIDLAQFVQRIKTVRAVALQDGQQVQSHSPNVSSESREAILTRLEKMVYKDFMAVDLESIAGGVITATQIKAAYEPLNEKNDDFEFLVNRFILSILEIAGIDDDPTFTRSVMIDTESSINNIVKAAPYLSEEYVTKKILATLGDIDLVDEVLDQMSRESLDKFGMTSEDGQGEGEEA